MTLPPSRPRDTILITGATRGIGRATALRLARDGHRIALTCRDEREGEAVVREVVATGGRAVAHRCDLADPRSVDALVDEVLREHGVPHGVVGNAAITADGLSSQLDLARTLRTFQVNLFTNMQLVARIGRPMSRAHHGRLVLVSSISSQLGNRGNSVYSATKGAMEAFMRSTVDELARRGVTINCVLPGFIDTGLTAGYERLRERIMARIPAGRLGTPEDVAAAVAFLMSPDAGYVNGICLCVDGGVSATLGLG